MIANKVFLRTLKGYVTESVMAMKNAYIIPGAILLIQLLINYIVVFITFKLNGSNNSNGGILASGFAIALVTTTVYGIIATTRKEFKMASVFPLNREVYAVGNFVKITALAMMLLVLTSIASAIEMTADIIMSHFLTRFIMINKIEIVSFLAGFWISLCYIVTAASLAYCIFMYFSRFKIIAIAVVCGALLLMLLTAQGRGIFVTGFGFYIFEKSLPALSIKLWISTLLFHGLAYLPLKTLEVKA